MQRYAFFLRDSNPIRIFDSMNENVLAKLKILAESAKYDVSCSSSGTVRRNQAGTLGNTVGGIGICHSFAEDGRCISLLKVMLTNVCIYDCQKFKNFELELEWKVAKGSNSGIFILAQEVKKEDGTYEPIYISSPECQVLDNENHPDARLGKDGNRMSSSLYDMIPAKPQNSKPHGEWNKVKILCYKGTVVHYQNDEPVVEYH